MKKIHAILSVGFLLMAANYSSSAAADFSGVIVKSVTPGGAGEQAGIQPGDRFTGWSFVGEPASEMIAAIDHPFDIAELELEQHPLKSVVLHGDRNGVQLSIQPGVGRWRTQVEPVWNEADNRAYLALEERLRGDELQRGVADARAMAMALHERGRIVSGAWLLAHAASAVTAKGERTKADGLYREAIALLDNAGYAKTTAHLMYLRGVSLMRLSRFDAASEVLHEAVNLHNEVSPDRLGVAANLRILGALETRRSNLTLAEEYLRRTLALHEKQVPDSLFVAETLSAIGRLAITQGEPLEAEGHYRRAVAIAEDVEPNGGALASYVNGLAISFHFQGDERGAESHWLRSLAMEEAIEPGSRDAAAMMHNIAIVKYGRGDFREAENLYRRSLEILERQVPDSMAVARTLNNLGSVALEQGDLAAAEVYHSRAYSIRREAAPDSLDLAASMMNLANVARQRGQLEKAGDFYQQALQLQERIAPDTAQAASIWINIGILEEDLKRNDKALSAYQNGLRIFSAIASAGRGVAETMSRMGKHALKLQRYSNAEQHYQKALSIFDLIAPNTYQQAQVFYGLARISQARKQEKAAIDYFEQTLAALESQHARLGGTEESKATARAKYIEPYKVYIDYLLELGKEERAFDILERSRSRVLLNLLSERDLVFGADMPAELERERRMLGTQYEKIQTRLYSTETLDGAAELQTALRSVRRQQQDLERNIREQAPRLADLKYGVPITLSEFRAAQSAGTAVISYSVGVEQTQVFALSPQGALDVQTLPLGEQDIDALVTRFRYLIDAGRWDEGPSKALTAQSTALYERLLLPFEPVISGAERILIVPDGALNVMPFAALVRPTNDEQLMYLAEWKPSLVVNSLTVQTQLRRVGTEAKGLVAFGDPDYSAEIGDSAADVERSGSLSRSSLSELPWSREEVLNIAKAYGADSMVYVGKEATEERAKALHGDFRFVHFAAHALLNEQVPLDTAIALSSPEHSADDVDNGFLQVWEVYESLRINADLVTLSGCETALGAQYAGEGLFGLTRAFQYAGASSVLASLWNVNDRSTSQFMTQLYADLADDMPQDKALQQSQIAMIRSADEANSSWIGRLGVLFSGRSSDSHLSHPYHWAGFVLNGAGE